MRKACVAVLAMVASLGLAACQGATYPTAVTFYRVGPGESQVTVSVATDQPNQVPRVTVVRETSDVVQVRAELDSVDPGDPHVPPIGVGYRARIVVNLGQPLGKRTLLAENGGPVLPEPTVTS